MLPNSPNTSLTLVTIVGIPDQLGNKRLVIMDSKEVTGSLRSITSSEFQASSMINVRYDFKVVLQAFIYNGQKYAIIKNQVYKIERTFVNGQFIELYFSLTDIQLEDLTND